MNHRRVRTEIWWCLLHCWYMTLFYLLTKSISPRRARAADSPPPVPEEEERPL